ncbi:hypothetical protein FQA39_LY18258 [Lamprigera yunnana]|nr:hypothetical protein FQA39_LY18258 [Lamprigera yunnana]
MFSISNFNVADSDNTAGFCRLSLLSLSIMTTFAFVILLVTIAYATSLLISRENVRIPLFVKELDKMRICTDLCTSGLGGGVCGSQCKEILPDFRMPLNSIQTSHDNFSRGRREICPILCENQLGFPLCQCPFYTVQNKKKSSFITVCKSFCTIYGYQVHGCQTCDVYLEYFQDEQKNHIEHSPVKKQANIDWDLWCKQQCSVNNGGSACNCDILPFRL